MSRPAVTIDHVAKVMLTLEFENGQPSLEQARETLGLTEDEIDADFGVVGVSPKENLYAVLVDEGAAAAAARGGRSSGPFSNPKIEPFGPEDL